MTFDQNRKMFKYQGRWYDVSEAEYLKNWHDKIKAKTIILDVTSTNDGAKPDVSIN